MLARVATPPALTTSGTTNNGASTAAAVSSPLAVTAKAAPPPQLQHQPSPKVLITYDADGFPSNLPNGAISCL